MSLRSRPEKSIAESYKLLGLVGSGQYGRVFCARRHQSGEIVALKELKLERFPTQNLLRELSYLLTLNHPNITRCFALEHASEGRYLVLEYCEGGTLRDLMNQQTLEPSEILNLLGQVLAGLGHAHSQGVVHCDIKPENILLRPTARGWEVKLTDFGIARPQQQTNDSAATGSPAYMAPERFYGEVLPAGDLYGIGIILYELLVGNRPFSGSPTELMQAHLNSRPSLPTNIPAPFQPILERALRKLPLRRYQSAAELAAELAAISVESVTPSVKIGSVPTLPKSILQQTLPMHLSTLLIETGDPWIGSVENRLYRRSMSIWASLPDPITDLYRLEQESILAITDSGAYAVSAAGYRRCLLPVSGAWQHYWHPEGSRLAWVTSARFGLFSLSTGSAQQWKLPTGTTSACITGFGSERLVVAVNTPQGARLWLYPVLTDALDLEAGERYPFPTSIRHCVGGTASRILVLSDRDYGHRLMLMEIEPFRIRCLDLGSEIVEIKQIGEHFAVMTAMGYLEILNAAGDQVEQLILEAGSKLLAATGSQIWIGQPDGSVGVISFAAG